MEGLRQVAVNEYVDIKNNTHKVAHFLIHSDGNTQREQTLEELFYALAKLGKRISV